MPPPPKTDPTSSSGNTAASLNPDAQRFLDRHVRFPLGRPQRMRRADPGGQATPTPGGAAALPTPQQLISRLAAVQAVHQQRSAEIPASRAKALASEIAGARAALGEQARKAALVEPALAVRTELGLRKEGEPAAVARGGFRPVMSLKIGLGSHAGNSPCTT